MARSLAAAVPRHRRRRVPAGGNNGCGDDAGELLLGGDLEAAAFEDAAAPVVHALQPGHVGIEAHDYLGMRLLALGVVDPADLLDRRYHLPPRTRPASAPVRSLSGVDGRLAQLHLGAGLLKRLRRHRNEDRIAVEVAQVRRPAADHR